MGGESENLWCFNSSKYPKVSIVGEKLAKVKLGFHEAHEISLVLSGNGP